MRYERLESPGRPGSKYPTTTSSTAFGTAAATKLREK